MDNNYNVGAGSPGASGVGSMGGNTNRGLKPLPKGAEERAKAYVNRSLLKDKAYSLLGLFGKKSVATKLPSEVKKDVNPSHIAFHALRKEEDSLRHKYFSSLNAKQRDLYNATEDEWNHYQDYVVFNTKSGFANPKYVEDYKRDYTSKLNKEKRSLSPSQLELRNKITSLALKCSKIEIKEGTYITG
jgi:hypothetical protein